jgi:hypothetical protein
VTRTRTLALALCLALAAIAAAASPASGGTAAAGANAGSDTAPGAKAADCVPVEHRKTIVKRKKVRRKGRWVKVKRKRVKRWWTCEPVEPPAEECDVPASTLGVSARDLGSTPAGTRYVLSRDCVTAGPVTVQLSNMGEDPHNLRLRPLLGPDPIWGVPGPGEELPPGQQQAGTFELAEGEWYLWCDLLLHEEQGMNAHLTVR